MVRRTLRSTHIKVTRLLASIAIVATAFVCASWGEGAFASRDQGDGSVDAVAITWLRQHRLPSVSIGIARGGKLLVARSYGLADLEHETPATDRTIYRIGSITKQFSAAAILRLAEQKRLSLDDRVSTFVSGLPSAAGNATIRQLLNHTSGIRSFTSISSFLAKERLDLSDDELLDVFKRESLDFEPGANFLYNNTGYYLIAMIIERVSGRSYAEHMRDEVFLPLGLADTSVCDDRKVLLNRARGYRLAGSTLENAPFMSMAPPKGGGNLCSTARDLVTWAHELASGRFTSPESYRLMTEPGTLRDGRRIAYGLGLFLSQLDERPEISHGGGINGFTSYLGSFPADELIVVTLTNSDSAHLYDAHLAHELVRAVSGRRRPTTEDAPADIAALDRVSGLYRIGSATITVRRNENRLVLTGEETVGQLWEQEFLHRGEYTFVATNNSEYGLTFATVAPGGMRLSMTLAGRAIGDATRVR